MPKKEKDEPEKKGDKKEETKQESKPSGSMYG